MTKEVRLMDKRQMLIAKISEYLDMNYSNTSQAKAIHILKIVEKSYLLIPRED